MEEREILATRIFNFMCPKFEADPFIKLACERKGATMEGLIRIMKKQLWKRDLESLIKMEQKQEAHYFYFLRCFIEISFMGDEEILREFHKTQQQQMN